MIWKEFGEDAESGVMESKVVCLYDFSVSNQLLIQTEIHTCGSQRCNNSLMVICAEYCCPPQQRCVYKLSHLDKFQINML